MGRLKSSQKAVPETLGNGLPFLKKSGHLIGMIHAYSSNVNTLVLWQISCVLPLLTTPKRGQVHVPRDLRPRPTIQGRAIEKRRPITWTAATDNRLARQPSWIRGRPFMPTAIRPSIRCYRLLSPRNADTCSAPRNWRLRNSIGWTNRTKRSCNRIKLLCCFCSCDYLLI
jgi:hypothetical protein